MSFLGRLFDSKARAAARDLERRVASFRAEVVAARAAPEESALVALRARPAALGLTEDDVALELEIVDGLLEVHALKNAAAGGAPLPEIQTNHRALGGEPCRFVAPACRPDSPNDPGGKLFFTDRRLVYLGSPSVTVGWPHVIDVREDGPDLLVHLRAGGVRVFRCNSHVDTLRGAYIASRLLPAPKSTPAV